MAVEAFWQEFAGGTVQATGTPLHTPALHWSLVVHRLASSQPVPSANGYVQLPAWHVPVDE